MPEPVITRPTLTSLDIYDLLREEPERWFNHETVRLALPQHHERNLRRHMRDMAEWGAIKRRQLGRLWYFQFNPNAPLPTQAAFAEAEEVLR